jgi:D-alanine--poly(phosphoribitol) ligase subunit 1
MEFLRMSCYLVQQRFDEISRKYSGQIALYFQDESISYENLYLSSNRIAHSLRRHGVQRGDRIAIILPKSTNSIRAILGTLKADAIYVPIDFRAPSKRIEEIIVDCSPSGIICDKSTINQMDSILLMHKKRPTLWVLGAERGDDPQGGVLCENDVQDESNEKPDYSNIDEDIAYILYTSGSTGKPKGVMISHLNIFNYINWATDYFQIHGSDRILNTALFHYDMSTFDIYCALHTGASLTIVPEKVLLFPNRIIDMIEQSRISIWKGVSSLLAYIAKLHGLDQGRMNSLRKIIFSGENLPTKYLIEWMRTYPEKEFYNAYGPTECTGISTCYRIEQIPPDANARIPIGKACANSEVFSLHDGATLARVGEVAELYIRGSSVGHGYWNDAEKTRRSFVRNPLNERANEIVYGTGDLVRQLEDGNYVFCGRKDFQIKHMGHRIELGEIEYALQGVEHVKDAAVIAAKEAADENEQIVAFIEIDGEADVDEIHERLKDRLPQHMMPTKIKVLSQIRRLENGKIDRQSLGSSWASEKPE